MKFFTVNLFEKNKKGDVNENNAETYANAQERNS